MIVRILGEGQFTIAPDDLDGLNEYDRQLQEAVEAGDEPGFGAVLTALLDRARTVGTPLAADALASSDLVLPAADSSLDEVRGLLGDEGLIPG